MSTLAAANLNPTQLAIPKVGDNVDGATKDKLRAKAQEFEAFYIQQFIALTRPDLSEDKMFGGGYGEQAFMDKMDEQVGKAIAERGGFGITDQVFSKLLEMQERTNNQRSAYAQYIHVSANQPNPQEGE